MNELTVSMQKATKIKPDHIKNAFCCPNATMRLQVEYDSKNYKVTISRLPHPKYIVTSYPLAWDDNMPLASLCVMVEALENHRLPGPGEVEVVKFTVIS